MAAFALGTAPLMVAFGTAGSLIPRVWKARMMSVLAIGVILFGVVFINRGLVATGAPITFGTVKTALLGAPAPAGNFTTAADGVVEVPITIENTQFVPQVVQIPADTPVRLIVDRKEDVACSAQIFLPQLNILQDLAPNAVTAVEIPPTKAGAYTLTCGMSMMSGQLLVGSSGAKGPSTLLWLTVAFGASASALYVAGRRDKRIAAEKEAASHHKHASAAASHKKHGSAAASHKKHGSATEGHKDAPEPVAAKRIFGFTPVEFALVVAAIAAAVFAGLTLGGMFV